jgi:two-component system, cell cycle sensor histidine kinase and response regulator CckA
MQTNERIGEDAQLDGIHVLIVDDDGVNLMLAKSILQRQGCTVETASNPVKALETYAHGKDDIDLVLVDYFMPTLDGGETIQHLRKLNPDIKVLLFSGADEMRLRQIIRQHKIEGYLHKPLRKEEALQVIRQIFPPKPAEVVET